MKLIHIKKILTHDHPDIDAMLSVLLLRKFGEEKFPGAAAAEVFFAPADELPDGKTAEELEREGIMAVDIGGGRFDTHPSGTTHETIKRDRCAADLVAEALGLLEHPQWKDIIEYTRQQDTTGQSLRSTDFIHHLTAFPTILQGFNLMYESNSQQILEAGHKLLSVLPVYSKKIKAEEDLTFIFDLIKNMADKYFQYRGIDLKNPHPANMLLAEWRNRLESAPETAFSPIDQDRIISLPALMIGFWFSSGKEKQKVQQNLSLCLDAVTTREKSWHHAIGEFDKKSVVEKLRKVHLVSIQSPNGLVIKAARFRRKADMIIYRNPQSRATSILLNRRGLLNKFSLKNLAAKIRIAECIKLREKPDYHNIKELGSVHDWFLHQSENLVVRGSKKAAHFTPSHLEMTELFELAKSEIDWQKKIPDEFCPKKRCIGKACTFFRLYFPCCKNHRKKLKKQDNGFTLADKFPKELLEKFNKNV